MYKVEISLDDGTIIGERYFPELTMANYWADKILRLARVGRPIMIVACSALDGYSRTTWYPNSGETVRVKIFGVRA